MRPTTTPPIGIPAVQTPSLESYVCARCKDKGWLTKVLDERRSEAVPCPDCGDKRLEVSAQTLYSLPERFEKIALDKMLEVDGEMVALTRARKIATQKYGWLNLKGDYGTGKTLMLVALVNAFKADGLTAVYMPAHTVSDAIHRALSPDAEYSLSTLERSFRETDLWALDEMDKAGLDRDPFVSNMIWQWLNWRYDHQMACAFAWNDTHKVHEGLLSRMNDGLWGDRFNGGIITLTAKDQRPLNMPLDRRPPHPLAGRTERRARR